MNYYAYYNYCPYQGYYPYPYTGQTWTPTPTPSAPATIGAPYTGIQFANYYPTPTISYGYNMSPAISGPQFSAPTMMYPYAGAAYYASYSSCFYQPYYTPSWVEPRIATSQTGVLPNGQNNVVPLESQLAKTSDVTMSIHDNNCTLVGNNHQCGTNATMIRRRQLQFVNPAKHTPLNDKSYSTCPSKASSALAKADLSLKTPSLASSRCNSLESQSESGRLVTRVNSTALNNNTIETETSIDKSTDKKEKSNKNAPISQTCIEALTDLTNKAGVKKTEAQIKVLHVAKRPVSINSLIAQPLETGSKPKTNAKELLIGQQEFAQRKQTFCKSKTNCKKSILFEDSNALVGQKELKKINIRAEFPAK